MMSIPTSELIRRRVAEPRRRGWHGGAGCARAVDRPRHTHAIPSGGERTGRRARAPDPGTGPPPSKRDSFDGHSLGQVSGLIDIVSAAIRNVIREKLEWNNCQDW